MITLDEWVTEWLDGDQSTDAALVRALQVRIKELEALEEVRKNQRAARFYVEELEDMLKRLKERL